MMQTVYSQRSALQRRLKRPPRDVIHKSDTRQLTNLARLAEERAT
jgi:hypothetical protein